MESVNFPSINNPPLNNNIWRMNNLSFFVEFRIKWRIGDDNWILVIFFKVIQLISGESCDSFLIEKGVDFFCLVWRLEVTNMFGNTHFLRLSFNAQSIHLHFWKHLQDNQNINTCLKIIRFKKNEREMIY